MADISTEISQIRQAVYGEQVRGSIVSALTKLNEASGKDWQAEIDKKQDKLSNLGGVTGQYVGFTGQGNVSAQNIIMSEISGLSTALADKQDNIVTDEQGRVTVQVSKGNSESGSGYWIPTDPVAGKSVGVSLREYMNSTGETNTGVYWIDNKPIYRTVITLNSQSGGKGVTYSLTSAIDTLVKMYGMVRRSSTLINPFPNLPGDINYVVTGEITNSGTTLNVYTAQSVSITGGYAILEYTRQRD